MAETWVSILPPLLAIAMALLFRQVYLALFGGIWLGAFLVNGANGVAAWTGLLDVIGVYLRDALADEDHAAILLLTVMIGGMVGMISKNGGMYGVVNLMLRWTTTPRRGQVATSVLGLGIFFDDYANTLVVGNTMRPVTDGLRISREKLAYIVDSTAAPVAAVALVTTWIGFQIGLVDDAISKIDGYSESGFSVFVNSLAYAFYPFLALFFVFAVAFSGRDFGPMLAAERRARQGPGAAGLEPAQPNEGGGPLSPAANVLLRARNALVPIGALVAMTLAGLWITGSESAAPGAGLRDVIGASNSYAALMWGSLIGVVTAFVMTVGQRLMTVSELIDAWTSGLVSVLPALVVLLLAWSLAAVCEALGTAGFLTSALGDRLNPGLLPTLVFVLAGATAFATGTSWGAMGILMPLVVPLAWAVAPETSPFVFYASVSAVLAGAVWGDHCSPLSDTTILSSMASGCDHIEHVRTQLPYAFLVGIVAIGIGLLPAGFGVPFWVCLPVAAVVLVVALRVFGRPVD